MSSARATLNWPPASLFGTPLRRAIAEDPNNKSTRKDSIMEIAPTSYLRVSGASDAAYLADLGINAMRVPIDYRHFESDAQPKVLIEAGLKQLDRAVDTLAGYGIYSIIDRTRFLDSKPPLALRQPNALAAVLGVRRLQGARQLAMGGLGRSLQGQRMGRRLQLAQRARRRAGRQTSRVVLRGGTPGA
jgi:hypothetical protein